MAISSRRGCNGSRTYSTIMLPFAIAMSPSVYEWFTRLARTGGAAEGTGSDHEGTSASSLTGRRSDRYRASRGGCRHASLVPMRMPSAGVCPVAATPQRSQYCVGRVERHSWSDRQYGNGHQRNFLQDDEDSR